MNWCDRQLYIRSRSVMRLFHVVEDLNYIPVLCSLNVGHADMLYSATADSQ